MTEIQIMHKDDDDDESLFQFDTYQEFQRERLKLNHDNTLKLWSLLPSTLDGIDSQLCTRRTLQQQKKQYRSFKFFAFYSLILKKTFLKKKIRSRGFRLWNKAFGIPPLKHDSLYTVYRSLGTVTERFLGKGKDYDSEIAYEELYKAGRTVWFMIAFQIQLNTPAGLTDSIFGYNMLYPYTDNFIDSNQVSREAKKEFMQVFHERLLLGESTYDPDARFDGKQSDSSRLTLPSSLAPHADRISKIFDMVRFIENDWKRNDEHRSLYMSLATIHESQMKSTLQHARKEDAYQPTMSLIEEISAEKGGASLIAAGFLVEGKLTKAKMAYLEYLGFAMQLLDDLQDFHEDLANDHRTVFTQTHIDGKTLDEPTGRLIQYCYCSPAFRTFPDDELTVSDPETGITLAYYVRISMIMFSITLILEAASRLKKYYSKEFYQQLSALSPIPFAQLQSLSVEEKLWAVVRNQWF